MVYLQKKQRINVKMLVLWTEDMGLHGEREQVRTPKGNRSLQVSTLQSDLMNEQSTDQKGFS